MLDNFKMNGIKFIRYNPLNDEHFDCLKEFDRDERENDYYPDWKDILNSYINNYNNNDDMVYLLKSNNDFIGICTIDLDEENRAVIAIGILSKCNPIMCNQVRGTIVKYLQENGVVEVAEYLKINEENDLDTWTKKGFKVTPVGSTGYFEIKHIENNISIRR